jgi:hypothetical protein
MQNNTDVIERPIEFIANDAVSQRARGPRMRRGPCSSLGSTAMLDPLRRTQLTCKLLGAADEKQHRHGRNAPQFCVVCCCPSDFPAGLKPCGRTTEGHTVSEQRSQRFGQNEKPPKWHCRSQITRRILKRHSFRYCFSLTRQIPGA